MSKRIIMLAVMVVLLTGCKLGSSGDNSVSSLLDSSSGSSSTASISGDMGSAIANPEPNTLALLGVGLAGLAAVALRKRKK